MKNVSLSHIIIPKYKRHPGRYVLLAADVSVEEYSKFTRSFEPGVIGGEFSHWEYQASQAAMHFIAGNAIDISIHNGAFVVPNLNVVRYVRYFEKGIHRPKTQRALFSQMQEVPPAVYFASDLPHGNFPDMSYGDFKPRGAERDLEYIKGAQEIAGMYDGATEDKGYLAAVMPELFAKHMLPELRIQLSSPLEISLETK